MKQLLLACLITFAWVAVLGIVGALEHRDELDAAAAKANPELHAVWHEDAQVWMYREGAQ